MEDSSGCPYNLTEDDDKALKQLNENLTQRKASPAQCTEDQFEEVMNFFEETAKIQQPFSSVGETPPILPWEDMQNAIDENTEDSVRTFGKDIYEHWRACREKDGNSAIHPSLKLKIMDSTNDTDDNDPYVCFRRREVRQVRKTRGRDAQSIEKLKKLRRELEEARALVALVRQREVNKKEQLAVEKQLFEQRSALRQCKRTLGEPYNQGDEDLLINQKVGSNSPVFQDLRLTRAATKKEAYSSHHSAQCRQSTNTGPQAGRQTLGSRTHFAGHDSSQEKRRHCARSRQQKIPAPEVERGLRRHDPGSAHPATQRKLRFKLPTSLHRVSSYPSCLSLGWLGRSGR